MELDDLKKNWKQPTIKKNTNTDIMELIQNKSYGPIAALKKESRKQIALMAVLPFVLIATNANDLSKPFTSILFWAYVALCIGIIIFAYGNYRIAARMEKMDGMVKQNLEQQINILEKRIQWKVIGLRLALLFLVLLTETVPFIQHYRMLDKWHSLNPLVRLGSYSLLFVMQYFVGKKVVKRKFGDHIDYLKRMVREMQ
jgi:hypothetical protein